MGDLVWDERLISRAEALAMPAEWPVQPGVRRGLLFLDCGKCGQAVLQMGTARSPFATCPELISQAVLRHMVSGHGIPLNYRRGTDGDSRGPRAAHRGDAASPERAGRGRGPGRSRAGAAVGRPAAEGRGRDREPGTAGGDRP